jgi:NAD dependent epimerase/dehydratase family enzyme
VVLRLGTVLGEGGGAFPALARLTRCFLGGAAGTGHQGISWIHQADLVAIVQRAVADGTMHGTYNACAPTPVSNADFMRTLRRTFGRPWCPPAPAALVSLLARSVLRTDPSLVLEGQFVAPARLLAGGYDFKYPQLQPAVRQLAGGR